MLFLILAFALAMEPAGFLPATFVFLAVSMGVLGGRRPLPLILYPGILTGVVYYLFRIWLAVRLPEGFLG